MYGDSRHSSKQNNKEFGRNYDKDIQENWNINQQTMIIACHKLGKTTKTIVKFANRMDAELVLKSNKK